MGVFSKCCAKTHLPVLYGTPATLGLAARLCHVMVLLPGQEPYPAVYDGYGLGLEDDWDEVKLVLQDAYRGERYEDLPPSEDDPNQGFFFDETLLPLLAGVAFMPSFSTYLAVLRGCDEAYEQELALVLAHRGLQGVAKGYEVMQLVHACQDCAQDPTSDYLLERYAEVRSKLAALQPHFSADVAQAAELANSISEDLRVRTRARYQQCIAAALLGANSLA